MTHPVLQPVEEELKKLQDAVDTIREFALKQMDLAEQRTAQAERQKATAKRRMVMLEVLEEKILNLEENVRVKQRRIDELTATLTMLAEADEK